MSIGIKAFSLTVWFCVQSTSIRADDGANQLDILLRCDLNISIQKSSGVENLRKPAIFNVIETPTGVGSNWRDKKPGVRIVPQDILLFDLVANSTFDINRITGTGSTEFSDMSTDTRWRIINYKYHVNRGDKMVEYNINRASGDFIYKSIGKTELVEAEGICEKIDESKKQF